jgi:hypothetical protein
MSLAVTINGNRYNVPTELKDITLRRHIALMEQEAKAPNAIKDIFAEQDNDKRYALAAKIRPTTYAKTVLPYFARYVSAATDIPVNILLGDKDHEGAPIGLIENWYWRIQLAYHKGNEIAKDKRVYEVNGQAWELPKAGMINSTFGEFAEAAQYEQYAGESSDNSAAHLPYMIAVILRPAGEKFDPYNFDEIVEQRAEMMRDLPMTDVQSIAFFLLKRNASLGLDSQIYTAAQTLAWLKREQSNYRKPLGGI